MDDEYTIAIRPDLQIVSDEVFLSVQKRRGESKHRKPWTKDIYILGEIVKCPICGGNLVVRKQSERQSLVLVCGKRKKHKLSCSFDRTIDMITLERIAVGESMQILQIGEEEAYKTALQNALVEFSLQSSMSREELDRKIADIGDEIVILARKTSKTELAQQAIAESLETKETEYQALLDQRSAMSTTLQFADKNLRTQTLAGALDILHDKAPFRPKTEEELDIVDTLRSALISVRLETHEDNAELLDVHVEYDVGKMFGSNVSHVRTLTFPGRNLMHHGALKRRAQAELEHTYSAGRLVLSEAEWRTRPDIPELSVNSLLPCRGRKLADALVLRIEADRPLTKCLEACGTDNSRYEKALDRIRMSEDINTLIEWLEKLRPGKEWHELRKSDSKLPPFANRFVAHPLILLQRLAGTEGAQASISIAEWNSIVPSLQYNKGYSFDLALRNMNRVLSIIQNGGSMKDTLGTHSRSSKFSTWLDVFEESGNLETATRHLLAAEGRFLDDMKFEPLPPGNTKLSG